MCFEVFISSLILDYTVTAPLQLQLTLFFTSRNSKSNFSVFNFRLKTRNYLILREIEFEIRIKKIKITVSVFCYLSPFCKYRTEHYSTVRESESAWWNWNSCFVSFSIRRKRWERESTINLQLASLYTVSIKF